MQNKITFLLAISVFYSATVFAGVTAQDDDASTGAEPDDTSQPSSQLRCWQYGQLIFEVTGWITDEHIPERGTITLYRPDQRHERLHLTGMENATCLYRE